MGGKAREEKTKHKNITQNEIEIMKKMIPIKGDKVVWYITSVHNAEDRTSGIGGEIQKYHRRKHYWNKN